MGKREIMVTSYREMMDMISCFAIANVAKPKSKWKKMTLDEAVMLW